MELSESNSSEVVKALTEPKKPLTKAEYKKMMSVYFTQRRDIVEYCGHTFYQYDQPKNNCPYCWFAFFQVNGEVTKTADEVFIREGRDMLIKIRGVKFTKNFLRFMATLAYMKENNVNGFGVQGKMEDIRDGREAA
jgi:hypothetical protein